MSYWKSHWMLWYTADNFGVSRGGFASDAGTQDYVYPPTQVDYSKSISLIHSIMLNHILTWLVATTAYGSQAMSQQIHHAHMMAMLPTRVPLPLDLKEDEPIYVNAKRIMLFSGEDNIVQSSRLRTNSYEFERYVSSRFSFLLAAAREL
ncbi:hypothetical protein GQ457_07G031080 [Hibiscus cannabinus]